MSQHVRDVSLLRLCPKTTGFHSLFVEGVGCVQEEICRGADFTLQKQHPSAPENPDCAGCNVMDFMHLRQVKEEPNFS